MILNTDLVSLRNGDESAVAAATELEGSGQPTRVPTAVIRKRYVGVGAETKAAASDSMLANWPLVRSTRPSRDAPTATRGGDVLGDNCRSPFRSRRLPIDERVPGVTPLAGLAVRRRRRGRGLEPNVTFGAGDPPVLLEGRAGRGIDHRSVRRTSHARFSTSRRWTESGPSRPSRSIAAAAVSGSSRVTARRSSSESVATSETSVRTAL
jgi:hypothetical protein